MFYSPFWDDFCTSQDISSFHECTDPLREGVLGTLMKRNMSSVVSYDCVFSDPPDYPAEHLHVEAHPGQSDYSIYLNGVFLTHFGTTVEDDRIVPVRFLTPGPGDPHSLLLPGSFPEFWGESWNDQRSYFYPRSFTWAQDRYLRIISYSDHDFARIGRWHEMVIDTRFHVVILYAGHFNEGHYHVWRMTRLTQRDNIKSDQVLGETYKWSSLG